MPRSTRRSRRTRAARMARVVPTRPAPPTRRPTRRERLRGALHRLRREPRLRRDGGQRRRAAGRRRGRRRRRQRPRRQRYPSPTPAAARTSSRRAPRALPAAATTETRARPIRAPATARADERDDHPRRGRAARDQRVRHRRRALHGRPRHRAMAHVRHVVLQLEPLRPHGHAAPRARRLRRPVLPRVLDRDRRHLARDRRHRRLPRGAADAADRRRRRGGSGRAGHRHPRGKRLGDHHPGRRRTAHDQRVRHRRGALPGRPDTGQWHTLATWSYNSNLYGPTVTPRVDPRRLRRLLLPRLLHRRRRHLARDRRDRRVPRGAARAAERRDARLGRESPGRRHSRQHHDRRHHPRRRPVPATNEYGTDVALYLVSHDTGQWHTFATWSYNSNLYGPTVTPRVVPGVYDVWYCHGCSTATHGISPETDATDAFPEGLRVLRSNVTVPSGAYQLAVDIPVAQTTATVTLGGARCPRPTSTAPTSRSTRSPTTPGSGTRWRRGRTTRTCTGRRSRRASSPASTTSGTATGARPARPASRPRPTRPTPTPRGWARCRAT